MSCEYCESRKPLLNLIDPEGPKLVIDRDAEVMDMVAADGLNSHGTFECLYCPICGDDWGFNNE